MSEKYVDQISLTTKTEKILMQSNYDNHGYEIPMSSSSLSSQNFPLLHHTSDLASELT